MTDKSITVPHFLKYLKQLFRIYKGSPFNIYLDNLNVHKNADVR